MGRRRSNVNELIPWISMAIAGIGTIVGGITKLLIVSKQLELQKVQSVAMTKYWQQMHGPYGSPQPYRNNHQKFVD